MKSNTLKKTFNFQYTDSNIIGLGEYFSLLFIYPLSNYAFLTSVNSLDLESFHNFSELCPPPKKKKMFTYADPVIMPHRWMLQL